MTLFDPCATWLADNFWGIKADSDTSTDAVTKYLGAPEPWAVFFLAVGAVLFAGWIYRREQASLPRLWRFVAGTLRCAAILLLCLIFFQPALLSNRLHKRMRVGVAGSAGAVNHEHRARFFFDELRS